MNGQCFNAEGLYEYVCLGCGGREQAMSEPLYQVVPKVTPRCVHYNTCFMYGYSNNLRRGMRANVILNDAAILSWR
jgi:hypothetical protein